jgi:hypothetical protein
MSILNKNSSIEGGIILPADNNNNESAEILDVGVKTPIKSKRKTDSSSAPMIILCVFMIGMITCILVISWFYKSPSGAIISGGVILPAVVEYAGIKNIPGKRFTGIETTRTNQNRELTDEVKKVLQAKGLPADIFKLDVPPDKNLAVLLKREFKIYRDNPGEIELLRKQPIFIDGKVNDQALLAADEALTRLEPKKLAVRQMLDDDNEVAYSFEIINIEGIGETPDISSAGYLEDYVLLEEYAIAKAIRTNKIRDAVIAIAYVFRITQLTAEIPSLPVRHVAATTRLKAIDLVQSIVFSKSFAEEDLRELFMIILEQLDTWCPESKTFAGYRASGMKTFNLIAAMGIDFAFEKSELDELEKRDKDRFEYRINQNWTWDHVFFLESMQTIIGSCNEPYYKRKEFIESILNKLQEKYNTPEELITSNFLLREAPRVMQYYAFERTKCEVAALTMAYSLRNSQGMSEYAEKTIESYTKELMTGKPYHIRQIVNETQPKINVVWGSYFGNMKPFVVPDYSKK